MFNIIDDIDEIKAGIDRNIYTGSKGNRLYNLMGQEKNRIEKGINIINGKKVLVK